MGYLKYKDVKIHWDFKLLARGFRAITLFGQVYCRMNEKDLRAFLKTYAGRKFVNHEKIHIAQAETFKLKWFAFYSKYIGYYLLNILKYGFSKQAYYNIPFEKEAYKNEANFKYLTVNKINWRMYK